MEATINQPVPKKRRWRRVGWGLAGFAALLVLSAGVLLAGVGAYACRPESPQADAELEYRPGVAVNVLDSMPIWGRDTTQLAPPLRARGYVDKFNGRVGFVHVDTVLGLADALGAPGAFRELTGAQREARRERWPPAAIAFIGNTVTDRELIADPLGWPVEFTIRMRKVGWSATDIVRVPGPRREIPGEAPLQATSGSGSQTEVEPADPTAGWPWWKHVVSGLMVKGCKVGMRLPPREP